MTVQRLSLVLRYSSALYALTLRRSLGLDLGDDFTRDLLLTNRGERT